MLLCDGGENRSARQSMRSRRLGRVAKREATHVIKVDGRGALWRILCDEGE